MPTPVVIRGRRLVIPRVRAPAPARGPLLLTSAGAAPAAAASIAVPVPVPVAALAGRGTHKGEINLDGLVEQLGVVCAVDGRTGFLEGCVLDESVSLLFFYNFVSAKKKRASLLGGVETLT